MHNLKKLFRTILEYIGFRTLLGKRDWSKIIDEGISYKDFDLYEKINNKIIFIHIPKAAGTSIALALYGKKSSHHATAYDYLLKDEKRYRECFSFTLTRNPYDRLLAAYLYLKSGGMNTIDLVWRDKYINNFSSFEDFVLNGLDRAIYEDAEHFIPQINFVTNKSGEIICDHIGKFEDINATIEIIKSEGFTLSLSKENSSIKKSDLNLTYTREMLDKVNISYYKDFKLFGYPML